MDASCLTLLLFCFSLFLALLFFLSFFFALFIFLQLLLYLFFLSLSFLLLLLYCRASSPVHLKINYCKIDFINIETDPDSCVHCNQTDQVYHGPAQSALEYFSDIGKSMKSIQYNMTWCRSDVIVCKWVWNFISQDTPVSPTTTLLTSSWTSLTETQPPSLSAAWTMKVCVCSGLDHSLKAKWNREAWNYILCSVPVDFSTSLLGGALGGHL